MERKYEIFQYKQETIDNKETNNEEIEDQSLIFSNVNNM